LGNTLFIALWKNKDDKYKRKYKNAQMKYAKRTQPRLTPKQFKLLMELGFRRNEVFYCSAAKASRIISHALDSRRHRENCATMAPSAEINNRPGTNLAMANTNKRLTHAAIVPMQSG
jgi:hypothetical protein|tara:strand:- start:1257 stop:1607 length:351 start_codon:yes stop_codon:yes gene_type:complete